MTWPCEETTLDLHADGYEVRLWITFNGGGHDIDAWTRDVERAVAKYQWDGIEAIANAIALDGQNAGLAAVQVRRNGVGHMIYTIRFDE